MSSRERILLQTTRARAPTPGSAAEASIAAATAQDGGSTAKTLPATVVQAAKESYARSLALDAQAPEVKPARNSRTEMQGVKEAGQAAFNQSLQADNAKRGASEPSSAEDGGLSGLLARVEASDASLSTLDLTLNNEGPRQQFGWLSVPQRTAALEQVAAGSALTQLLLDSLGLGLSVAAPLAAAVRSHAGLERLSLERNGLNDAALVQIAEACAAHPALQVVAVAHQCNQELLGQAALIALLDAMEATPQLTTLKTGKIVDPSLRRRADAATMANRDQLRKRRVAAGVADARRAAGRTCDWALEARNVAGSSPYAYGVPLEGANAAERQAIYSVGGTPLWKAATEAERAAVLAAFATNTKVVSLVLVNALLSDALVASHMAPVLRANRTMTSLNLESNMIGNEGLAAIAAGLESNTTLTELKLANQRPVSAVSQAAELGFADAVFANRTLLRLTIDQRNTRARELTQRALSRNQEELRLRRRRAATGLN